MTRKERILRLVQRQPDDVSYAEVIRRLLDLSDLETAIEQADRGEFIDHDELVRQLEVEWRELESSGPAKRKKAARKSVPASPKTHPVRPRNSKSA